MVARSVPTAASDVYGRQDFGAAATVAAGGAGKVAAVGMLRRGASDGCDAAAAGGAFAGGAPHAGDARRTGDIVVLTGTGKAACGRTAPRFRVVGRADDMVVVRGINAFPTQVAAVINQFPELSGEYRIVLDGPDPYDMLPVEAEVS